MSEHDGSPRGPGSPSISAPEGTVLDALVAEAKQHLDVRAPGAPRPAKPTDALGDIDWSRLESRVMASIEDEKPALLRDIEDARGGARSREIAFRAGALILAAAAAVALVVRKDHRDVALVDAPSTIATELTSASSLRSSEGAGQVRVAGLVATPGHVLRASDAIEVEGARAVFERPRKVTWLLEQAGTPQNAPGTGHGPVARARVKSAGEPLVLGLEDGVIEAQVVPVATGEAFAVDIATERSLVRVAVHGTHLRVAREGSRVVVDLTEGVVSIGVPPRTGVTYGTIVTAPAHVELDANDLGSLQIDHAPTAVRAAVPLGPGQETAGSSARLDPASAPAQPPPAAPLAQSTAAKGSKTEAAAPAPKHDAPKAVLSPRETIAAAVRDCAVTRGRSGDVLVTVSSNLRLRVSAAGVVESAQFSPPLLPEIQSCAARAIYKTKLDETGVVTIPIEFSY